MVGKKASAAFIVIFRRFAERQLNKRLSIQNQYNEK